MAPSVLQILEKGGDAFALSMEVLFRDFASTDYRQHALITPSMFGPVGMFDQPATLGDMLVESNPLNGSPNHIFHMLGEAPLTSEHRQGVTAAGQNQEVDKFTISIDKRRETTRVLGQDDLKLMPVSVMPRMMMDMVQRVRQYNDLAGIITLIKAARAAAVFKDGDRIHTGGKVVTRVAADKEAAYPASTTGANRFIEDLTALGLLWTTAENAHNMRIAFVDPYIMDTVLPFRTEIFSRDFSPPEDAGNLNKLEARFAAGFWLVKTTNHLPARIVGATDSVLGTEIPTKYHGDFTAAGPARQPVAACVSADPLRRPLGFVHDGGPGSFVEARQWENDIRMKQDAWTGWGEFHPFTAGEIGVSTT